MTVVLTRNQANTAIKVNEAAEIMPEEQMMTDDVRALMAQGKANDNMFKKVDQQRLHEER